MSFPVMSYKAAHAWEPMAEKRGVSKVARSSRGFMRAYQRAGSWAALDPWWKNRRDNFVKRHMAQAGDEDLWKKDKRTGEWKPSRRGLALLMWAYMPPGLPKGAKTMKNPRRYGKRWTGSALGNMSGRKSRALGMTTPLDSTPDSKDSEATVRARLERSPKFQKKDGTPNESKINWFIGKLRKEGKIKDNPYDPLEHRRFMGQKKVRGTGLKLPASHIEKMRKNLAKIDVYQKRDGSPDWKKIDRVIQLRIDQGYFTLPNPLRASSLDCGALMDPACIAKANRSGAFQKKGSKGAVGGLAITPKLVPMIEGVTKKTSILDFGSGKNAPHAQTLAEQGYNVTAYDFGSNLTKVHDPKALSRTYRLVYASNVLNVQCSEEMFNCTARQLALATRKDGMLLANYPSDPRYWVEGGKKVGWQRVQKTLQKHFKKVEKLPQSLIKATGAKSTHHVFLATGPKH